MIQLVQARQREMARKRKRERLTKGESSYVIIPFWTEGWTVNVWTVVSLRQSKISLKKKSTCTATPVQLECKDSLNHDEENLLFYTTHGMLWLKQKKNSNWGTLQFKCVQLKINFFGGWESKFATDSEIRKENKPGTFTKAGHKKKVETIINCFTL